MTRPALFALVLLAAAAPVGWGVQAQDRQAPIRVVPGSREELRASFAPAVKRSAPAVVSVFAARVEQRGPAGLRQNPFFQRFFGGRSFGDAPEEVQRAVGSGVIVDPSGLVVTNHHVIEGMTEVKVALADRRELEADIVLRDPRTDLAVLKLKGGTGPFPTLEFADSDTVEVGDLALAVGNPFGVGQTVTQGIISALARTQVGVSDYKFFIQTDAAINPGNSGGALIDVTGRLVGINTAIFSESGGSLGIGFAVPANMVRVVVASARGGGATVRRPWFGARLQGVTPELADGLGLDRPIGALVASVVDGGPAAAAGVRRGDLLVSLDGQPFDDPDGFGFRYATKLTGGTAKLGLRRAGRDETVEVRLVTAPEVPPRETLRVRGRGPLAGASLVNLSPAVADELSLDPGKSGVAITEVEEGAPASQVGFRKGDVLLAVNDERLASTRDAERALGERAREWKLVIERGGQVLTTYLRG